MEVQALEVLIKLISQQMTPKLNAKMANTVQCYFLVCNFTFAMLICKIQSCSWLGNDLYSTDLSAL